MRALIDEIRHFDPCDEAIRWLGQRTLDEAWSECRRGDWLLWLAAHAGVDRRQVVLAACDCAKTLQRHVPKWETGPAEALRVARAWARGKATRKQVRAAADDAAAFAFTAVENHASAAAFAAFFAADAAAYAAAARAARAAAYADAWADSLARSSAGIVRARISAADVNAALKEGKP